MRNSLVFVSFEFEAGLSEQVHGLSHALLLALENNKDGGIDLLFFEVEIELPGEGFASWHLAMLVGERDAHLDESQVVTIRLYHLVFEFSARVCRNIDSSGILSVLLKWSKYDV